MTKANALLCATMSMLLLACNKSDGVTTSKATSQWTFDGKTFKVTDASYDYSSNTLTAADDGGSVGGGNFIKVTFGSATKPSKSATLTVVDFAATSNPTNCDIQVGNVYDATRPLAYLSTGKVGDKVDLTVSSTGKLSVSFSNITVFDRGSTTKTVSGTLTED